MAANGSNLPLQHTGGLVLVFNSNILICSPGSCCFCLYVSRNRGSKKLLISVIFCILKTQKAKFPQKLHSVKKNPGTVAGWNPILGCTHIKVKPKRQPCSFMEDIAIPKLIMLVVGRRSALWHRTPTCLEEFSMDHLLQQAELNSSCHQAGGGRNALPARIICFII